MDWTDRVPVWTDVAARELIAELRHDLTAQEHDKIYSALRSAYARGRAGVLQALTCQGANGEVYNAYNGGEDLREFLA